MKYKSDVASPDFVRDTFVSRSRNHALNSGISALAMALVGVVVVNYVALKFFDTSFVVESVIVVVCFSLLKFGNALGTYTEQDRDIILSQHFKEEPFEEVLREEKEKPSRTTEFPHPLHKNGMLFVSVELTEAQKEKVARIGLEKKSLPINLLESLGLSRQNAERLRMELGSHGLGYFTDNDRFVVTQNGEKVFAKILRKI